MAFQHPKTRIFLTGIVACIVLLTAACGNGQGISIGKPEPTVTPIPDEPVEFQRPTYTVERGTIIRTIQFSGRLGPDEEVPAVFEAAGRVGEMFFQEGDMVKEGDLIATLDFLPEMQREFRLNEIALRRVEISVERAQLLLDETLRLNPNNTSEIQMREWDLELAQLALEETSIYVGEQQENLEGAMLVAPVSGMIIDMNIRLDKQVEALAMAVVIADIEKTSILVDSYTVDVEELSEGMAVTLSLVNQPGETYTGTISQMPYPYGTGPGRDTNKNIYIDLDEPGLIDTFQIGDRFTIQAEIARAEDVLWLPPQAIREFGGRTFVMIQDGELQRSVDVVKGLTNGEMTEILEGVEEGMIVVGQ